MTSLAKIVFAGCSNVGKSSIVHRYDHNKLLDVGPTIGACFVRKTMIRNGETMMLDIWDTAGQERYYSISSHYFRNATYCILVFDVTDADSFNKLDIWKKICDQSQPEESSVTYFLVGNKIDKSFRIVTPDQAESYCREKGIYKYIETSAATGEGIATLFYEIGDHVHIHRLKNPPRSFITPISPPKPSYCNC